MPKKKRADYCKRVVVNGQARKICFHKGKIVSNKPYKSKGK